MSAASTSDALALSNEALRPPGVAKRLSPARRNGCAAGSENSGSAPRSMMLFGSAGPFALAVEVKSIVACRCRFVESAFPKFGKVLRVEKELEAKVCPTHELHSKCTTRQAHTHGKPRPPEPTKARARSPAQQVHHASGTHTQGLRNGPSTTKFAHIRYALTSHLSRPVPHAPPQLRFVWESSS